MHPGNTAPFKEMLQRWRAVGNTVSDLTGPRFEPQTSRSGDELVTARLVRRHLFPLYFIEENNWGGLTERYLREVIDN